jgi:hypothetical protein
MVGKPFPPGNNANPTGRPKGVKNRLATTVLRDLLAVWDEPILARDGTNITRGVAALRIMSKEKPADFAKLYASLMPREFWVEASATAEMDDVELDRVIEAMRERLLTLRQEKAFDVTPPKALPNVVN